MAISFDGPTKRIALSGETTLDVRELYSAWKEWVQVDDNSKYTAAFSVVGGEPISVGVQVTTYAFLLDGWRVKPDESDHTLTVSGGVLLTDDGSDPFVPTTGTYNVLVKFSQPIKSETITTGTGEALLAAPVEGLYSLKDVLRVLVAVLAGKTVVTDLGGGQVEAVFRDLADAKARVTATLEGEERTAVTLDVS